MLFCIKILNCTVYILWLVSFFLYSAGQIDRFDFFFFIHYDKSRDFGFFSALLFQKIHFLFAMVSPPCNLFFHRSFSPTPPFSLCMCVCESHMRGSVIFCLVFRPLSVRIFSLFMCVYLLLSLRLSISLSFSLSVCVCVSPRLFLSLSLPVCVCV